MYSIFFYSFSVVLLAINAILIYTDLKSKKILNKLLLTILGILFVFLFVNILFGIKYDFASIGLNLFGAILFSFFIYFFNFWGAGDSKYLFVLSFFILVIKKSVLDFVLNIGLIVIFYLLFSVFFYYFKIFISPRKIKEFFGLVSRYIKEKFLFFLTAKNSGTNDEEKKKSSLVNILNYISVFVILFFVFRIFNYFVLWRNFTIFEEKIGYENLIQIIDKYWYVISLVTLIFGYILFFKILRYFRVKARDFLTEKIDFSRFKFGFSFVSFLVLLISLIATIFYNGTSVVKLVISWFVIYFLIRIFLFIFQFFFHTNEESYIDTSELKEGMYIDFKYLKTYLGNHHIGEIYKKYEKDKTRIYNYLIYSTTNPLNKEGVKEIKNIFKKLSQIDKNFELKKLKIMKVFPFSIFLFLGFLATFWFKYNLLVMIITLFKHQ
ncbi:MAG: hypothetical protein PHF46_02785 [Candidatus Gracilibacteria bacterium]|nr:hypothetical protein [Candidatus Gracilibacteria bacterium]MDD4530876.1 hypothetical protein [Candidatus Gracilibacteria bacterium]